MSMETIWISALFAIAGFFGLRWWQLNQRLAGALFGHDGRLEYIHQRWVLSGTVNGLQARYTAGAINGWIPALSYLWLPMPVNRSGHITTEAAEPGAALPPAVVQTLRDLDGFKRLDIIGEGLPSVNTLGRISWLSAGEGLLLCRYTKHGGDADAVKRDVALLAEIGEHVG